MAFVAEIGRLVIKIMFHYRFDLKYTYHDFDPKTKKTIPINRKSCDTARPFNCWYGH